jgi:hypothetical protein
MKNRRKKYIRYGKERAILSDVLPYEVPIIFSNRYFYRFLVNNNITLKGENIEFTDVYSGSTSGAFREILKLLFDAQTIMSANNNVALNSNKVELRKIPFNYRIAHKESDFRELTVIHPLSQLSLIEFYEKYKEQIIYYSKVSPFSIRRPDAVAKFVYFNDKLHDKQMGENDDFLELRGKEYENLKSFFAYKKYTNIYRFYEDYRYQRAEKKYKILYKFDITKCFDSIYSHSIVWALTNKEIVKDYLGKSKLTFGGRFDRFIQNSNSGETNGIVIGPEFSRIFAEIILQQVDKNVELKLREVEKMFHKKDYETYRYVDDYFLFCDSETVKECIVKHFRHELKEFKMALNDSKSRSYVKPMITEISIAKQKINHLFEKEPHFKILKNENISNSEADDNEEEDEVTIIRKHIFKFYVNPNKLATKFKTIIKESNVEYKDVLNYTLAILNNKIEKILRRFEDRFLEYSALECRKELSEEDLIKKKRLENNFTKFIIGYIDFIFFLYSVSPRVNSSIKLASILAKLISYYKGNYKGKNEKGEIKRFDRMRSANKDIVFKKISDDISLILERHQMDKHTQVEVLYLLVVLKELGENYRLSQYQLAKYFNCINKTTGIIELSKDKVLNYFSIVVLLFYIKDIKRYIEFKGEIKKYIIHIVKEVDTNKRKRNAETVLLIMDLLVCPYLENDYKETLLKMYSVPSSLIPTVLKFKEYQKYWFVKWENFDLAKELNSKNSEEVYS